MRPLRVSRLLAAGLGPLACAGCFGDDEQAAPRPVPKPRPALVASPPPRPPAADRRSPDQGTALVVVSDAVALTCSVPGTLDLTYDPRTGVRLEGARVLASASADAAVVNRRLCRPARVRAEPPATALRAVERESRLRCATGDRVRIEIRPAAGPAGLDLGRRVVVSDAGRLLLAATLAPEGTVLAVAARCR